MSNLPSVKIPLGVAFNNITRQYISLFYGKLKHLNIDKYYSVLLIIHQSGNSICQQKIADQLKIDKASMVRMLDYLKSHDLLEKKVNEFNRREYLISLTQKAKKIIPDIEAAMSDTNKILFNGINQSEKKIFLKVLGQITNHFDETSSINNAPLIKAAKNSREV